MNFRIGIAKGRGASECARLLETGGVALPKDFAVGRPTVYTASERDLLCVTVRGRDVVKLLDDGHIDVAIASGLIFDEYATPRIRRAASLETGVCGFSLITQDLRPIE